MQLLEGSIHAVASIALPVILQGDGFMRWLLALAVLKVGQGVVIVTVLHNNHTTKVSIAHRISWKSMPR